MFENPRRGRQTRNFTTDVPKILVLKSSSEKIFFQKFTLGAPGSFPFLPEKTRKTADVRNRENLGRQGVS